MKQYLVSVFEPAGDPPPAAELERISAGIAAIHRDLEAAGAWVFAGGLHPPSTATVLRPREGEVLDAALRWGRRFADANGLPIEVRPFRDEGPA